MNGFSSKQDERTNDNTPPPTSKPVLRHPATLERKIMFDALPHLLRGVRVQAGLSLCVVRQLACLMTFDCRVGGSAELSRVCYNTATLCCTPHDLAPRRSMLRLTISRLVVQQPKALLWVGGADNHTPARPDAPPPPSRRQRRASTGIAKVRRFSRHTWSTNQTNERRQHSVFFPRL